MSDLEFYEKYVRKLGVEFDLFCEHMFIIIDNSIKFDAELFKTDPKKEFEKPFLFVDECDKIKYQVLAHIQKEQLLRLTKKLL